MKILFLSAEVEPFAKRGGLGDVAGSLPKALAALGHDVRVMMPAYGPIEEGYHSGRFDIQPIGQAFNVSMGPHNITTGAFEGKLPNSEVPIYFIAERNLLGRPSVYGYEDDAYRFAFFSRAALELSVVVQGWRPDVLHAHDWHTAPAITWLATAGTADPRFRGIPTLFTIHNLAHQGQTDWEIFHHMGILTHALHEEPFGAVNFMARGIYHATKINTVSPTYADEIMTTSGGGSVSGLLRHRHYDVHGLLNGLDYDTWNPATDPLLAQNFTAETLPDRAENKRALQAKLGLPQRDNVPLLGMVSRLDWQKGLDLMVEAMHRLMNNYAGEAQFVLLGSGDPHFEHIMAQMASYHSSKLKPIFAYRADLAPLIYGGTDMFLMPSRFEPCGLGQLIAMRYGSVPVVRATGGLADTVTEGQTGFLFHDYSADAFWDAIARAIYVYNVDKPRWAEIQTNGLTTDFSWERSAKHYQTLYEWALTR